MRKRVAHGAAIRAIINANPTLIGSRVCIAAGISHAHLSNVMAGRKPLSEDKIHALAKAMGVDVEAISIEINVCDHEPLAVAV